LPNTTRIDHILDDICLYYGDLTDSASIFRIVEQSAPDEIYNLAAQSHVRLSFDQPAYTTEVGTTGIVGILEAARGKGIKVYQASSSEMFGSSPPPQNEDTVFKPCSPYAASKVYGYNLTKIYREAYSMFACNGILFNHESPRRSLTFVTRKTTIGIAKILSGKIKNLEMGNLEAKRDWGHASDYVEAMYLMMQKDSPDDYVIATGETRSVREFVSYAFSLVGLDYQKYVTYHSKYERPNEVGCLLGDCSKAKQELGWEPKIKFEELVQEMLKHDLDTYNELPSRLGSAQN